jgi:hypothetical protein
VKRINPFVLVFLLITLASFACNITQAINKPTSTPTLPPPTRTATPTLPVFNVPTQTAQVTPGSVVQTEKPVLSTEQTEEEGQNPAYSIKIAKPHMESGSPVAAQFNEAVDRLVTADVERFKQTLQGEPVQENEWQNTFDLSHRVVYASDEIVSVLMDINIYYAGAAHPMLTAEVFNYDIEQGKILDLGELFEPDTAYLSLISAYCTHQLQETQVLEFPEGAVPTLENYRNWNITVDGILITFDPYQVASYAIGRQSVTVPYAVLRDVIRKDGPIALFKQ